MIKLKDILTEKFEIDLEVGDTILRGKFKNKPVVVKDFGVDDKGQPTINGKKMLSFRIKKLMPKYKDAKTEGKLTEDHPISFSKEEMAKLHKDGSIEKDGHTYIFTNEQNLALVEPDGTIKGGPKKYLFDK